MTRLIVAALFGLMLSACSLPPAPAQDIKTASDQTPADKRASIRLRLATQYLEARQYSVALDEVKQAINIDPTLVDAYHVRALVYMGMNETALAEDSFRTALSMRDSDPDVLNNYGWFLCQNNRYAEAKAMLQRAVQAPSMNGPVKPLTNLGACEMRNGDLISAQKSLQTAYGYDRNDPALLTNLAQLSFQRGEMPQAKDYVGRVNSSRFASAQSLWLGARIARRQGDTETQNALTAQLRSRFPDSRELTAYERGAWDE
ncbi:type IV pilus assembly protein PilF [Cupriavidus metallidurans]|jgi:type IV pilus assembly protein PilF|uniref:Type IV pilus biogenesis protein PilF n=1 Tax=Cupriavidus metallidurans (strain ATCC 43123 / DSM 2839 / NBRC 102507 / CH34) TaxID=266264 RepID=Q1LLI9_CUPMC|nr:type IV pilus biogenesis/stability protein PilW [Cupriavidus metallidurans]ABF08987.1 Type IV pilus biogenesis protein PilF [Cupriavidus metallidurans CH34]AVA36199.1 type IV pilus biogenesis/stability protein PilW [Cupriavidus metallidurans]KWW37721.1 Lipopolysaccharide assembly protein B [Cupriavidus metallidurans]MDE4918481.1 type IV pilus biogenesis/stability protein PilW [Cupriavidus metallidurans]QGS30116.1 type IV pilus biogenesis/stability protein PilW [Cupriavidus metallidurans]